MAGCACLFGLCLITAGCTRGDETRPAAGTGRSVQSTPANQSPAATSQGLAIEFRSEPDPPEAGDNTIEVTVKQPDGSPLTDATVTAVFSMPAMPSMNKPAMKSTMTLPHESAGRYRGTGQLSMGGTWTVTVTVSRGAEELGRKSLSVVAK
jgi:nitrogen fixation protein FixH